MNYREALVTAYCANPCQVLPNALWKTTALLERLRTAVDVQGGAVTRLEAWDETRLMVYWTRDRGQAPDFAPYPGLTLALIHQDYMEALSSPYPASRRPYFRLIHRPGDEAAADTAAGYCASEVKLPEEIHEVAQFIGQCYPDIHPTASEVSGWTAHPVFDAGLWVWVVDAATGSRAGLGIAEIDREIGEGSLEWIQVLPEYWGRGIGKQLVRELLERMRNRVAFTTVAGEADNKSHPEALYRRCGFTGDDVWWVLTMG